MALGRTNPNSPARNGPCMGEGSFNLGILANIEFSDIWTHEEGGL